MRTLLKTFAYRIPAAGKDKDVFADTARAESSSLRKSRISLAATLELSLVSALNYFRYVLDVRSKKPRKMFIGAGSGLFSRNGETLDSYYPYKEPGMGSGPYWLSADFPEQMLKFKRYILKNRIVVFSFLSAPLAAFIGFVIRREKVLSESPTTEKLCKMLADRKLLISFEDLERLHSRIADIDVQDSPGASQGERSLSGIGVYVFGNMRINERTWGENCRDTARTYRRDPQRI